ncbi:MAG: PilZ domain-containing protein [Planctomycetota bacterium]
MTRKTANITLRDIQIAYDGQTLTICSVEDAEHKISMDSGAVEELIDFVQTIQREALKRDDGPNRRESFRVPVLASMELECELLVKGKRFEGKATNISMTGVYVEKQLSDPMELHIGDPAQVRLSCAGDTISLQAQVRRLGQNGYGLFFPVTMKGPVIDPPQELRRIVMELQRRWMAFRSDTA